MPSERTFNSIIPLITVIELVEAEAAPDGWRIALLNMNGNGQALAQEISLTYISCDPRDQPAQLHHEYPGLLPHALRVSNARGTNTCVLERAAYLATFVASALAAAAPAHPAVV